PPTLDIGSREVDLGDVLTRARAATDVLAAKAGPGEAAAYRHWLVGIADQVVNAAKSGGFLGIGGSWVTESERRFVDELSTILDHCPPSRRSWGNQHGLISKPCWFLHDRRVIGGCQPGGPVPHRIDRGE